MIQNISHSQNREIDDARSNHIENLVDIIVDLDDQVIDWKNAADCRDPGELKAKLDALNAKIEDYEEQIRLHEENI